MEEIVVLSSDSSYPPSPEPIDVNCENSPPMNDLSDGVSPKTSCSDHKRPANFYFSSSEDSDDSLPPPPSGAPVMKNAESLTSVHSISESTDVEEVIFVETHCNPPNICSDLTSEGTIYSGDLIPKTSDDVVCEQNTVAVGPKLNKKKVGKRKLDEEARKNLILEKEKRKTEQAQEKALKKAYNEAKKAQRPGHCLKYIRTLLDQNLLTEEYSGDILLSLQNAEMMYEIQPQLFPKSVLWAKLVNEYVCDDDMKITASEKFKEEALTLLIISAKEMVDLVKENKLRVHIRGISSLYVNKRITLVIYKLQEYYRLQNCEKQRKFKAKCRGQPVSHEGSIEFQVSQSEIEKALIEIQIFEKCSHRMVETSQDLGSLIVQFAKALAEREFKLEKQKVANELEWFAAGASRDTVRVDKDGNGLLRLWKQQICQFHNASIDTAEAIMALYPSPVSLMKAYANCSTPADGRKLLQDIPIRRGAGPLSSVRRIGPELSKKIYNFFTALEGETALS